jgi:hypothetical protein
MTATTRRRNAAGERFRHNYLYWLRLSNIFEIA